MRILDSACLDVQILGANPRNLVHRSFVSLAMLISSSKAHLNSSVRPLLELYFVIVIKHVAFFTICMKLLVTMAFTFTFLDEIAVSG